MDINKIKKEDLSKMKVWELCKYIREMNPDYKFCGYLPKEDALIAAESIYDNLHLNIKTSSAISWDEYFMGIAKLSAQRSKDPKTKVGACIVDPKTKHIISIGYNGFPNGMEDDPEIWNSDEKHKYVVHAEANAILNSCQVNMEGMTLYVTQYPCNECAKLLVQKGIKKIIYLDDKFLHKACSNAAIEIFKIGKVEITKYKGE